MTLAGSPLFSFILDHGCGLEAPSLLAHLQSEVAYNQGLQSSVVDSGIAINMTKIRAGPLPQLGCQ